MPANSVTSLQCLCNPKSVLGCFHGHGHVWHVQSARPSRVPAEAGLLVGGLFLVRLLVVVLLLKWCQQVRKCSPAPGREAEAAAWRALS